MLQDLTIEELYEEFDDLPDWDERCDYLIDLGFNLPQLPDEVKADANRVHGCQSNVWLFVNIIGSNPPIVEFLAKECGRFYFGSSIDTFSSCCTIEGLPNFAASFSSRIKYRCRSGNVLNMLTVARRR